MKWLEKQRALYRSLGPLRFVGICAAILAYLAVVVWLDTWLSDEIGWPEAYGFSCHRKCLLTNLWHSFSLLSGATGYEIALFALLWHLPVLCGSFIAIILITRRLRKFRNGIRPMEE